MSTPHLAAVSGDFAPDVLMPGDPLRAKFIAERFLDDAQLVTDVRGMFGYTGTFEGHPVSVQGSGMGVPSISIYATELIREYGVKRLIRVGSCGSLRADLPMRSLVIGSAAGTDSGVNRARAAGRDFAAAADYDLLRRSVDSALALNVNHRVGRLFTSDSFYAVADDTNEVITRNGFLAVEMEAAALYGVAIEHDVAALAICTVSDHLVTGEALSTDDRQTSFDDMMKVALNALAA